MTTEALVREIRRFRPHVMTTYDENGGYPHPDHIMTHTVSMAAFAAAGDAAAYPHAGEPWQPLKIYYNSHNRAKYAAFHEALLEAGRREPVCRVAGGLGPGHGAHHHHPRRSARTASTSATRRCWRTPPRSTRTASWFRVPREMQASVWPTEDFEAALSYLPVEPVEDDLFAGIPDAATGDELATRGGLEIAYDGRKEVTS